MEGDGLIVYINIIIINFMLTLSFLEILMNQNYNLSTIETPVDVNELATLLRETNYDRKKSDFLINGFAKGFSLQYRGRRTKIRRLAPNLKFRIGDKIDLWNKVMKEVGKNRYAGPFEEPPYKYFIQSPIGLVPKDHGRDSRLIFHLSYPRNGDSVNSGTPEKECKVKYPDFNDAVQRCMEEANL